MSQHTSDRVLRSVNGMRTNPTPVRAVLPTSKSPAVVNLTFPVVGFASAPLARKYADCPTNVRSLDKVRKYMETPGTFLRAGEARRLESRGATKKHRGEQHTHRYRVGVVPRHKPRSPSVRTTSLAVPQVLAFDDGLRPAAAAGAAVVEEELGEGA